MNRTGFTLIELVAVMGIMGILLTIGTLSFNRMTKKSAVENQTRLFFSDLMETRLKAMYKKKSHFVNVSSSRYAVYTSGTLASPAGKSLIRIPKYPITWAGKTSTRFMIEFDSQGLTNNQITICVNQNEPEPTIDSIVISYARVNMGKRLSGATCNAGNITIK